MSQLLSYYKSFQQPRPQAPNLQPTFEDLTIDDNLSELQRLVRYSRSAIGLQRLVHVKMIHYIATNVGYWDTNVYILPLLVPISNDIEPAVRQHLMEQLAPLAQYCCEEGEEVGYAAMIASILPVIAVALEDDKPEVRHAACTTLVSIAKLVHPEDLGQHVLTIILQLAHEDDKEDRRMTAAELLNSLAEIFGTDLCKQFVIPEVVSLAEDPVFRVRKSTALNFYNICKVGGEFELFERLMPAFVRLSKDDMYRVRRACADSITEIAKYVNDDIRVGVLTEIYLRLTQDPSKLVKQSTLQQSGMFIASLPSQAINETILGNFFSMAMSPTGDSSVDAELRRYCAFSFPAVLQTIGVGRWLEVRELYHALVQSRSNNVKQTLACSLHEVARILSNTDAVHCDPINNDNSAQHHDQVKGVNVAGGIGGMYLVEQELIPVFESMLQDVEAVQMGVIKHLSDFLRMLPIPCRVSYLPLLHDILHSTNPFNWRLRQCLAVQLPALLLLPPPELVFSTLFPLVMTLLQDPVATVRRDSFKGVAKMVIILAEQSEKLPKDLSLDNEARLSQYPGHSNENIDQEDYKDEGQRNSSRQYQNVAIIASHDVDIVAKAIKTLIQGKAYQSRQLWVELSHVFLVELPRELFVKYFLDGLLYLTSDRVSNVRVAVGIVLAGWEAYDKSAKDTDDDSNNASELQLEEAIENYSELNKSPILRKSSPWNWLLKRRDIQECVERLANDDRDVYLAVINLQAVFPDIRFKIKNCKGIKDAPGGRIPVPNMVTGPFSQLSVCAQSPKYELSDSESESGDEIDTDHSMTGELIVHANAPSSSDSLIHHSLSNENNIRLKNGEAVISEKRIRSKKHVKNNLNVLFPVLENIPVYVDTPHSGEHIRNEGTSKDRERSRFNNSNSGLKSPERLLDHAELLKLQEEEREEERRLNQVAADLRDSTVDSSRRKLESPVREVVIKVSPHKKKSDYNMHLSKYNSDDDEETKEQLSPISVSSSSSPKSPNAVFRSLSNPLNMINLNLDQIVIESLDSKYAEHINNIPRRYSPPSDANIDSEAAFSLPIKSDSIRSQTLKDIISDSGNIEKDQYIDQNMNTYGDQYINGEHRLANES